MKPAFSLLTLILLGLMLCLNNACDSETETLDFNYNLSYFPMDSAHWVIYQVDSVIYSKFLSGGKDSVSWQLKEVIAGTFIDNEGREARKIERYTRRNESQLWTAIDPVVWYALRDSQRAERMEGDLRFIKMVFPISEGKSWKGNSQINTDNSDLKLYADWNYTYTDIDQPKTIVAQDFSGNTVSNSFDKTLTVSQTTREDNDNLVEYSYGTEQYAENVGMIFKELWLLELGGNDISDPAPWPDRAETGFITTYKILDYKQ
jgi:hypothetical protein